PPSNALNATTVPPRPSRLMRSNRPTRARTAHSAPHSGQEYRSNGSKAATFAGVPQAAQDWMGSTRMLLVSEVTEELMILTRWRIWTQTRHPGEGLEVHGTLIGDLA